MWSRCSRYFVLMYVGHRVESAWERHSVRTWSLRAIEGMWTGLNELGRTATIVTGWLELARHKGVQRASGASRDTRRKTPARS